MKNLTVNNIVHDSELQEKCGNWSVYEYPRRAITADVVCFNVDPISILSNSIHRPFTDLLLVKRINEPYKHHWCLPGGFVDKNETVEDAARRELEEETGLKVSNLFVSNVYSDPVRDSRGTITVAYFTFVVNKPKVKVNDDENSSVKWINMSYIKELGFDHKRIVGDAFTKFKEKIEHNFVPS